MYNPIVAEHKDIERVHVCVPDVSPLVSTNHLVSAGGAIKAGQEVMKKHVDSSFALVRPPGHHAHRIVYGGRGFCVANNEAVMIERIREEFGNLRVAIVDTDCHHGDGTEDIYWNDKETLLYHYIKMGKHYFQEQEILKMPEVLQPLDIM